MPSIGPWEREGSELSSFFMSVSIEEPMAWPEGPAVADAIDWLFAHAQRKRSSESQADSLKNSLTKSEPIFD